MPTTLAHSGNNRENNIRNFIRLDSIKNLDVHRDRKNQSIDVDRVHLPIGQVPSGTTLHTYKLGLDNDAKLKRKELKIEAKQFPRNTTDQISFEPPAADRPFQLEYDRIVTRAKYGVSDKDMRPWAPRAPQSPSITNMSGHRYDIITLSPIRDCANSSLGLLAKNAYNRKNIITEIQDFQHVS